MNDNDSLHNHDDDRNNNNHNNFLFSQHYYSLTSVDNSGRNTLDRAYRVLDRSVDNTIDQSSNKRIDIENIGSVEFPNQMTRNKRLYESDIEKPNKRQCIRVDQSSDDKHSKKNRLDKNSANRELEINTKETESIRKGQHRTLEDWLLDDSKNSYYMNQRSNTKNNTRKEPAQLRIKKDRRTTRNQQSTRNQEYTTYPIDMLLPHTTGHFVQQKETIVLLTPSSKVSSIIYDPITQGGYSDRRDNKGEDEKDQSEAKLLSKVMLVQGDPVVLSNIPMQAAHYPFQFLSHTAVWDDTTSSLVVIWRS